ncbi:uncharacterized protein PpBr36_10474 [Pyricularia pennisetigena]|uniref:uncharacterized protein n=1 Tax=Pyricularia pennisetigena TaxID=1578925 RepID=UPI001154892C|nr:uncharacterized protein PpBr36_10474 [Pyricularia pennisetigena]TLS21167.1 hypothetical protein PpBr36_10474 [Pyricularia pennisetigena]
MKFQIACVLSLMAYSAAALPAGTKPGTIVQDTQGVKLRDGEVCKATSTEGVLACHDPSGASFNINLRLRPSEFCTPIDNQPGVFGCNGGQGGTFNMVNGKRQKRSVEVEENEEDEAVEARSPKIRTDSRATSLTTLFALSTGNLFACPAG